jgi:O-antigen ligase
MSEDQASLVQGVALATVIVAVIFTAKSFSSMLVWARSPTGMLIALHASAAAISGVWNGAGVGPTIRYIALLPAVSVILFIVASGERVARGFQIGLTGAGLVFVGVHLAFIEPAQLLDPNYRISVFLNTNSVAFITMMTAMSLLTFPLDHIRGGRLLKTLGLGACFIVWIATKSRTSLLAFLVGSILNVGMSAKKIKIAVGLGVVAILILAVSGRAETLLAHLDEILMLHDKDRSIESGTSRYEAWSVVIGLWIRSPLLGVGPGQHEAVVQQQLDISSAHNGWLANLADVGLLGTLPLAAIVVRCLWRAWRSPHRGIALPLIAAGLVESGAEILFFSMGNPGSLLFIMGLCLADRSRRPARSRSRSPRTTTTPAEYSA